MSRGCPAMDGNRSRPVGVVGVPRDSAIRLRTARTSSTRGSDSKSNEIDDDHEDRTGIDAVPEHTAPHALHVHTGCAAHLDQFGIETSSQAEQRCEGDGAKVRQRSPVDAKDEQGAAEVDGVQSREGQHGPVQSTAMIADLWGDEEGIKEELATVSRTINLMTSLACVLAALRS